LAKYMLAEQNKATRNGKIEFCRRIFWNTRSFLSKFPMNQENRNAHMTLSY
jgi:hypothetical protein